jgi:hypothetical protein
MERSQSVQTTSAPPPFVPPEWMELDQPLGHPKSTIFPLSETLGTIEGIEKIRASPITTDFDELSKFHYLPEGAEVEFETARTVEVLVFHMTHNDERREYSVMREHSVALRAGGRLSGPLAWHLREPMKEDPFLEDGEEKVFLALVGVISLLFAFIPLPITFMMMAAFLLYWCLHEGATWIALRTIEKKGCARIYGPSEQLWD